MTNPLSGKLSFSYTKLLLFNHMGALVTAGVMLLLGNNGQYKSSTLRWNFEVLPRQVWGALFIVTSILVFLRPKAWTGALFASAVMWWGVCAFASILTGDAESLSGWIWPTLVGINMLLWTAHARFDS